MIKPLTAMMKEGKGEDIESDSVNSVEIFLMMLEKEISKQKEKMATMRTEEYLKR